MDLKLLDAEPTDAEREAVDAVVGVEARTGTGSRGATGPAPPLLPALRAAQRRVGWVTPGALGYTSRRLDVPPADAYGVATFYALLSLEERRRRCSTSAPTSRAGSPAPRFPRARAVAVPRPVRAGSGVDAHDRRTEPAGGADPSHVAAAAADLGPEAAAAHRRGRRPASRPRSSAPSSARASSAPSA